MWQWQSSLDLTVASGAISITVFTNPLERIRANKTARVPFIIGNMQDDGSLFTLGDNDLAAFLDSEFPGIPIPPDFVRSLYPGLNDTLVISASLRDLVFLWYGLRAARIVLDVLLNTLLQSCRVMDGCGRGVRYKECLPLYVWYVLMG